MDKTGEAKLGITKCSACEKPATLEINGHLACSECASVLAKKAHHEKKAEADPRDVMFPGR